MMKIKMLFISLVLCLGVTTLFAQKQSNRLKVLSYNIHVGNPPEKPGVVDLEAIAEVINDSDADLVALQEVDVFTKRSGKDLDQAKELAILTNRHYFFAKAIDHQGGEYGIAVLSKFPIVKSEHYLLPKAEGVKGEQRAIAIITVEVKKGVFLDFASTHLDLSSQARQLQADFIINLFKERKNLVVLAGDFNANPDSEEIKMFESYFKRSSIKNGFTFPVKNPKVEIDYIMFAPQDRFKVDWHVVVDEHFASDHLPLFVEFSWK